MRNGVWCITIHTTQHTAHAHTRARAEARGNFSFLLSSPLPSFPLFSPLLSPLLSSPLSFSLLLRTATPPGGRLDKEAEARREGHEQCDEGAQLQVRLLRESGVEFKEHGKHAPNVRDLVCKREVTVWGYEEGVTCSAVGYASQ